MNQATLQTVGVKASLATAAVGGGLTLGQAVGATAFAVSLAVAIGSIALSQLNERAKKEGYEFITVYRWTKNLEPGEFTINEKDPDGYLSVWKDLASQRPKSYNVPMLAMFKLPRRMYDGELLFIRIYLRLMFCIIQFIVIRTGGRIIRSPTSDNQYRMARDFKATFLTGYLCTRRDWNYSLESFEIRLRA